MFLMMFVNNLAGIRFVPWWMQHFTPNGDGMTFVDLVFPAFLVIAGVSIPFALGSRINRAEPVWKTLWHVLVRVIWLLLIGVIMVNEMPDAKVLGWSPDLWRSTMYFSVIAAFCWLVPPKRNSDRKKQTVNRTTLIIRIVGFASLICLAFAFRGVAGQRIVTLSPLFVNVSWWGILGQIGWCYLAASVVFLLFRTRLVAALGCIALMVLLYVADKSGTFKGFWLNSYMNIGGTLGTHAMLTTAGVLLGAMLITPEYAATTSRVKFNLWFIVGFSAAALLMHGQYGINKIAATPFWALWGCAVTAAMGLILYLVGDVWQMTWLNKPHAGAGQNVLLAYLVSQMLSATLAIIGRRHWSWHLAQDLNGAIMRAFVTGVAILTASWSLSRCGFRLKL